ncbi:TIGR01777 family protein [Legionella israelensis]|uniref:TIGR01777 family protein n=1 Tax=Legionella israelensis TaxID=454 RepID=A0AAX1EHJ8_9GAMM|nr:TIGR01777 family oxidoreductase [Legionella israelensis]QBR84606.1 TIGR01777 family protein [Legionella israelensis]
MDILIAGASGFIGQELVKALKNHHQITVLGRDSSKLQDKFSKEIKQCTWDKLDELKAKNYDAVINLCGHNISAGRWTVEVKQKIIDSRVDTTTSLINWAISQNAKPHFYCANAVGIYGLQKNGDKETFNENSPIEFEHPRDFLNLVGARWQQATQLAIDHGMNVTITRFGVVLKKGRGMLKKLTPSYYLGLGSVIGDGQQVISWVHLDDVVHAYLFLLEHPDLIGAFNITSPYPVEQKEFAKTLAKSMHRPLLLKTPAIVIRLLFGEMGDCLINKGQRVAAKRLIEAGYQFRYPELKDALTHEFE